MTKAAQEEGTSRDFTELGQSQQSKDYIFSGQFYKFSQ